MQIGVSQIGERDDLVGGGHADLERPLRLTQAPRRGLRREIESSSLRRGLRGWPQMLDVIEIQYRHPHRAVEF